MKYLIISDLHLGDGTKSDDFITDKKGNIKTDRDVKFIRWIESLQKLHGSIDKIILNGDILELWQFGRSAIERAHSGILNYFAHKDCIWIRGNHDYQITGLLYYDIKMDDGKNVHVEHGFRNDDGMTNPFSRFGVWCLGVVEKFNGNIENELESIATKRLKMSNVSDDITINTNNFARKLLKKNDYVVFGHTHSGGKIFGNYYNSGTCQGGKYSGVLVSTCGEVKIV